MNELDQAPGRTARQNDVESLAQGVEPDPAVLARLLADQDPGRVLGALLYMRQHDSPDPQRRRCWAASLPWDLQRYAPEAQLLLAELYLKLCHWHPTRALPDWRSVALLPAVEVAWWRTELLIHPETLATIGSPREVHYQALHKLSAQTVPYPQELIVQLAQRDVEHWQLLADALLRDCLSCGVVTAGFARGVVEVLCRSEHTAVAERALGQLCEPWATCGACPTELLQQTLDAGDSVLVAQAVRALVCWRQSVLLEQVLQDGTRPGLLRREAMAGLGDIAGWEALDAVLSLAASDPLLYGEACIACLSAYHHRGIFPRRQHLADLLTVYTGCSRVAPETVAMIAYTRRDDLVEELAGRHENDAHQERWLALLIHLPSAGVQPLLLRLLESTSDRRIRLAVIAALAAVECLEAEDPLLLLLEREPEACLDALRILGGDRTADRLRQLLGVGASDPSPAVPLRPYLDRAVSLLWHLTPEGSDQRRELLRWLNPADLPPDIRKDLGVAVDPAEVDVLMRADMKAHSCLEALCQLGSGQVLPLVADLLLRHVSELNTAVVRNEEQRGEARFFVFATVKEAIRRLGERLHACGKIRPRCLLQVSGSAAGDALLAALLLDLIDNRKPSAGELKILLEALDGLACPPRRIQRLLRRGEPAIRKVVIRLLGQRQAAGLAYNLGKLAGEEDVETIRSAVAALGSLRATWAVQRIAERLDHPNMNIKKTAAEALRTAGTVAAVPSILLWLGQHDNPGFRQALLAALHAILGNACLGTLLAALEQAAEPRRQDLLVLALDRKLTSLAVRRAVLDRARYADRLLRALQERRIELAAGSLADLAAELALFGIALPSSDRASPSGQAAGPSSEIAQLMAHGWEPELVVQVLRQEPSEHTRWLVRNYLKEWLGLLDSAEPTVCRSAWQMFLDVDPRQWLPGELSLLSERIDTLLTAFDRAGNPAEPGGWLRLLTVLIARLSRPLTVRLATFLRGLPRLGIEEGKLRYRLLEACGVLRDRADLRRVVADCLDEAHGLLVESFHLQGIVVPGEAQEAQTALQAAARAPGAEELMRLRKGWTWPSRVTLQMLALVLPRSAPAQQDALLDWMLFLQPLDEPAWTLTEEIEDRQQVQRKRQARRRASPFEQPPSAELRGQLRTLLGAEEARTRQEAAEMLLSWPEAASEHQLVLSLFLAAAIDLGAAARRSLSRLLVDREPPTDLTETALSRWLELCDLLADISGCLPWLLRCWETGPATLAARAEMLLRRIPAARLLPAVSAGVERNRLAFVDLLNGPVLRTDEVQRILDKLDAAGDRRRAEYLRKLTVTGCWRPPAADDRAVAELRSRLPATARNRAALVAAARGDDVEQIRAALKELVHEADATVIELFEELTRHRQPRVRSLALRCLRQTADRARYLKAACGFLHDPRAEAQRSAIRIVAHGRYRPAIPTLIDLLQHKKPQVRRAASEGLALFGKRALPALAHAHRHARPDRKEVYAAIIAAIRQSLSRSGEDETPASGGTG